MWDAIVKTDDSKTISDAIGSLTAAVWSAIICAVSVGIGSSCETKVAAEVTTKEMRGLPATEQVAPWDFYCAEAFDYYAAQQGLESPTYNQSNAQRVALDLMLCAEKAALAADAICMERKKRAGGL